MAQRRAPVKLGDYDGGMNKNFVAMEDEHSSEPRSVWKPVAVILLVVAVVIGVFLGLDGALSGSDSEDGSSSEIPPDSGGDEVETTPFPTVLATDRPTTSPTKFPTTGSPTVPTAEITRAPSRAPTNAPVTECTDPDAQCGCNQVTSSQLDIIFVVDESGSVTEANYNQMIEAITDFTQTVQPPFDPEEGTRFAYIEFSDPVNDVIDFDDFDNAADFNDQFQAVGGSGPISYDEGGTDHRGALLEVQRLLERSPPRETAQLLILMITDGVPCKDEILGCYNNNFNIIRCRSNCGGCCDNSAQTATGVEVLEDMADEYDFTFFYLPIRGGEIDVDLFNPAVGPDGLREDQLVVFEVGGFNQIAEFLQGDDFEVPLGPCIDPPTSSSGRLLLLEEELENAENVDSRFMF